jgi:tetratricopeptide (TPR) repeat protein
MTIKTTRAALAALLLASSSLALSTSAFAQNEREIGEAGSRAGRPASTAKPAAKAAAPNLSAPVGRVLGNVQTLVTAKKFPEALAALKEVTPTTDYDKLMVSRFTVVVAANLGDEATAATAAAMAADLPEDSIPVEERAEVYRNAASLALNTKQTDKALAYARKLDAVNPTDANSKQVIAVAFYTAAPPAEAIALLQRQIDATVAAGQRPGRDLINMKINAHLKANDNPGAEATLEQALLWFNQPADWEQIVNVTMSTSGIRDIDAVMLGRLLYVSGAPVSQDNAQLVGDTSQKLAMYGDAQTSIQKGAKLQLDTARVNSDKNSMPEQIKMGATQNGLYNVKLSEALYGYGMYPEAEAAARLGLSKGGADASEAQMLIAMSLYQQGKLAEASAAFQQVQGGSPATPRIARLWNTLVKIKLAPPAAAAP